MNLKYTALAIAAPLLMNAQEVMSPETLWKLRKISVQGASPDHSLVVYRTSQTDLETEKNVHKTYLLNTSSSQSGIKTEFMPLKMRKSTAPMTMENLGKNFIPLGKMPKILRFLPMGRKWLSVEKFS